MSARKLELAVIMSRLREIISDPGFPPTVVMVAVIDAAGQRFLRVAGDDAECLNMIGETVPEMLAQLSEDKKRYVQ